MYDAELDSFLLKFRQLWRAGYDAHLNVNSHAGQAWVGLHVRLGHAQGPLNQDHVKNVNKARNGPSRQRRRERRADARKQAGEASKKETTEVVDNLIDESNDVIVIEEITTDSIERPIEEKDESEKDLKKHNICEYAAKADKKIDETNCDKEVLPIYHNSVTYLHIVRPLPISYVMFCLFLKAPNFGKTRLR